MDGPVVRMINRLFAFLSKCTFFDSFYLCRSTIKETMDMGKLITDQDTDMVFFSRYINGMTCWKVLRELLDTFSVKYALLPYTKDIWVRDYMPVQISEEHMLQYTYNPDYLEKYPQYITDPTDCCRKLEQNLWFTTILFDGGNVVKCPDTVIMTDKILKENNSYTKIQLVNEIENLFQAELLLIPWDTYEKYGHADGMVRYVEGNRVLINHYCDFDKSFRNRLIKSLSPKFEVVELHYDVKHRNRFSWAYINFLLIGKIMFLPYLESEEDRQAFLQMEEIYHVDIAQVDVRNLVTYGGALNCVSWNVKANKALLNYYNMN